MTTHAFKGYLENDYLTDPFGGGTATASTGMQARGVILGTEAATAAQAKPSILDYLAPLAAQVQRRIDAEAGIGIQALSTVLDRATPAAMQALLQILGTESVTAQQARKIIVDAQEATGQQARGIIGVVDGVGMQTRGMISGTVLAKGSQAFATSLVHIIWGAYLETPYLEDPYLVGAMHAIMGHQARGIISTNHPVAMQARRIITGASKTEAMQSRRVIEDFLHANGMQVLSIRDAVAAMQVFVQLYNTDNLRILSEFASRGTTGSNWTASSTEAGDFSVLNLNTDIEEQYWRSATGTKTSIILVCDTEVSQGIFNDTIALRYHNLTSSASVIVEGSNSASFATIGVTFNMTVTADNMYWIAEEAPRTSYRYWRFTIDDPTNTDNYVRIGTILFGTSRIFQGESFVDQVSFSFKDFADTVETEGFTNVTNSRSLKKTLHLDFRTLRFSMANFRTIRELVTTYRTTHKLLWIPTPDPTDMESTGRFAVYGKLTTLPQETHNWKGSDADYVALSVDIDESK